MALNATYLLTANGALVSDALNMGPASVCILCIVTILTGVPLAKVETGVVSGAEGGTNGCEPCVISVNVPAAVVYILVI